jgi:hypothetical protein
VDRVAIPALIVMGEYEQYQRRRSIETAARALKQAARDVRLIIHPGVGRGLDFRGEARTFADDPSAKGCSAACGRLHDAAAHAVVEEIHRRGSGRPGNALMGARVFD